MNTAKNGYSLVIPSSALAFVIRECKPLPRTIFSAVRAPNSAGTLVSWFPPRFNLVNAVSPPSSAGTLVSRLPPRSHHVIAVSPASPADTLVNRFLLRFNLVIAGSEGLPDIARRVKG